MVSEARPDDAARRPRDAGLQAERTALSWNRTALAIGANALLALRSGWTNEKAPITVLAVALLVAAGAGVIYGAWRRQRLLGGGGSIAPSAPAMAVVAMVALVACATGIASILVR